MINVYMIDDHRAILDGLALAFDGVTTDILMVGSSETIEQAIQEITSETVDIILLDLKLEKSDPIKNIQKLRNTLPTISIVIYSGFTDLSWQLTTFYYGVRGFICKITELDQTVESIHRVFSKGYDIPSEVLQFLLMTIDNEQTPRKLEHLIKALNLYVENNSMSEIAKIMGTCERTIDNYFLELRKWADVGNNVKLVNIFKTS